MSFDRQLGQDSYPSFEAWKAGLDQAWETRGLPGYKPSRSRFERFYVPGPAGWTDRVVYLVDLIAWNGSRPAVSPEAISERYRSRRAVSDRPQRI